MAELKNLKSKCALTRVNKHCKPEVALWREIKDQTTEGALTGYLNLMVHLLCELSEEREKFERLNKNEIQ